MIRSSGRHDAASFVSSAGADFYDPVALRCNRHIMLDQNDGVASLDEPLQLIAELCDIGRMQSRRRLIENV